MALWEEKLALRAGFAGNEATDWGTRQESSALARYEQLTGHLVGACRFSVLRDDAVHGWLGASPDGLIDSLAVTPGQTLSICFAPALWGSSERREMQFIEGSASAKWGERAASQSTCSASGIRDTYVGTGACNWQRLLGLSCLLVRVAVLPISDRTYMVLIRVLQCGVKVSIVKQTALFAVVLHCPGSCHAHRSSC